MHPVFTPGFHCSGAFQIEAVAAQNIARLLHFIESKFGASVHLDGAAGDEADKGFCSLIDRIGRWRWLLREAEAIRTAWGRSHSEKDEAGRSTRERLLDGSAKLSDVNYLAYLDALHRLTRDLTE